MENINDLSLSEILAEALARMDETDGLDFCNEGTLVAIRDHINAQLASLAAGIVPLAN